MGTSKEEVARRVKAFVSFHHSAVLSTVSKGHKGYPFGSVAPIDVDPQGNCVVCISRIAEHYKNVTSDPRCSVLVSDQFASSDPQALGRATLLGELQVVPENEIEAVSASYNSRFPENPAKMLAHDFVYFRLRPERVRWIGGFGEIFWIEGNVFQEGEFDSIAYHGMPAVNHMNRDHPDSLETLVRRYSDVEPGDAQLKMVYVSHSEMVIAIDPIASSKRVTISFPHTIQSSQDLRETIVSMLRGTSAESPQLTP